VSTGTISCRYQMLHSSLPNDGILMAIENEKRE